MNNGYLIIEIISCVVSGIAAIINIILLYQNRLTLKEVKAENDRASRSIESETIAKIVSSQQNILFNIMNDNSIDSRQALNGFSTEKRGKLDVYGTMYINHFHMVFMFYKKGFLGKDEWIGLQNDIKYSFENISIIKERWGEVRATYSTEFQQFIDNLISNGRLLE